MSNRIPVPGSNPFLVAIERKLVKLLSYQDIQILERSELLIKKRLALRFGWKYERLKLGGIIHLRLARNWVLEI